jgi:hypothetical protein
MTRLPGLRPSRYAGGLRGPRERKAKSGEPRAESGEPDQEPRNVRRCWAALFVGAHLCATSRRSGTSRWCGRAQVRSYKGYAGSWVEDQPCRSALLWERTLCATNLRSGTPQRGCAHRVRSHRQAKRQARHECAMHGQGRSAARLRFKSSGIRARCAALCGTRCVPSEVVPSRRASSVRAYPNTMLRALSGHSLWVTFDAKLVPRDLLGQQEKSDSSGGSRSKRPPRRRHPGGSATTRSRGSA